MLRYTVKLYRRTAAIKTASLWYKNRQDQWNGVEDPEIKWQTCAHLMANDTKTYSVGGEAYLTMILMKLYFFLQKNKIRFLSFTLYKNILKLDQRPSFENGNIVISKKRHRGYPSRYWGKESLVWGECQ